MEDSEFIDLVEDCLETQHEADAKANAAQILLPIPDAPADNGADGSVGEDAPNASWQLCANVRESFGYSLVKTGIPLITGVALTNISAQDTSALKLHVRISSDQADEPIATRTLALEPLGKGETVELGGVELEFDARHFVQLDEQTGGRVEFEVEADSSNQTFQHAVRLLAYNQWDPLNEDGLFETLAVHVLPNHPRIEDVRRIASTHLAQNTGSSSQEGYQSGGERATQIAKAIYESLQACEINYSDPPASSETFQKIRTPDQILDDKFGTCLDTTCLYAACLEQAGLSPLLFVVQGHAFAGFWLEEGTSLKEPCLRDQRIVNVLKEAGKIVLVETTVFTAGKNTTFDEATAEAESRLLTMPFVAMIDIRLARQHNLHPLPSRIRRDDGVVEIHHDEAAAGQTIVVGQRRFEGTDRPLEDAPARVRNWQADLLDLSLRNPLLNLRLGGRGGGIRLSTPPDGLKDLELRLASGDTARLIAYDQLTDMQKERGARTASKLASELLQPMAAQGAYFVEVESQRLKSRISGLRTKARTMEDECGANILHLCLGSVVWTDPDKNKEVRSPLLLLPARLETKGRGKPPQLLADLSGEGTTVNQCLLEKLRQAFHLEVPEVASWRGDQEDSDIGEVFRLMREAILRDSLAIDVEEDASLALLHFGKFRMWRDLHDHWPQLLEQPLVRHLVEHPGQEFVDASVPPASEDLDTAEAYCPVDYDGSQLEAILAASSGCSFVLEGPPGTGKSQTITNLIANALAHGRRILFVAEKRAALDVVKTRLARVGLAPYCLDIHDKKSTPQHLREQLKASLDAQFSTDLPAFERTRSERDDVASELRDYVRKLHEPNGIGLSAWSARQQLLKCGEGPTFRVPDKTLHLTEDAFQALERALEQLPRTAEAAGLRQHHPWGMVDADNDTDLDFAALSAAIEVLHAAEEAVTRMPANLQSLLAPACDLDSMMAARGLLEARLQGCEWKLDELAAAHALGKTNGIPDLHKRLEALKQERQTLFETFQPDVMALDARVQQDAIHAGQKSFFLFRKGRLDKAEAATRRVLLHDNLDTPSLLKALAEAEKHALATKGLAREVRELPGLALPTDWNLDTTTGLEIAMAATTAIDKTKTLSAAGDSMGLASILALSAGEGARLLEPLRARQQAWATFAKCVDASSARLNQWLDGRPLDVAARDSLSTWQSDSEAQRFLDLGRWCRLVASLALLRTVGLDEFADALLQGRVEPGDAVTTLRRSVAESSLDERMRSVDLQRFDGQAHSDLVERFTELHGQDSNALTEVLPYKLLQTRPFKPGQRAGQVGDLYRHELTRRKGGRSIRALIEEFTQAISVLTPCVLASPASVAQYLAPGVMDFDLVIFDEASQIPVADAVGAMGRGKAVVIVGDSKQMPPTTFFSGTGVSSDEDGTSDPDAAEDLESILSETVASGLRRIWLSWHYRSQDEALIAFSNRFYYGGRLASFPAPGDALQSMGVAWHKVEDGLFLAGDQRTNEPEALAIVEEVRRRANDPVDSNRSLGIVALNLNQAELIRDLLEKAATEDPALSELLDDESEEGLFVKNLENVQGDERDVILISVTYAKNQRDRLPMNFGPLNRIGGERRWNVLITRAKQQVVVFSSIEPEDIKLERVSATAKGVHHMREYMLLARDGIDGEGEHRIRPVDTPDFHRIAIAERLRSEGLVVEENLGLSAFKVDLSLSCPTDPGRRLVAVLLDGDSYSHRRTVQDRDGLPATVLAKLMRWHGVARIWLPQWLTEPERVVADLLRAVENAKAAQLEQARLAETHREVAALPAVDWHAQSDQTAAAATVDEDEDDEGAAFLETLLDTVANSTEEPQDPSTDSANKHQLASHPATNDSAVKWERDPEDLDFVAYENEQPLGNKDDLAPGASGLARERIAEAIDSVLATEAPIESSRLAKLVAKRFGLQRTRQDRIDFVLQQVRPELIQQGEFGTFVWSEQVTPTSWQCFRRATARHARTIDEIAPEEIRNALRYIAEKGLGVRDESALADLAEIFGIKRLTKGIRERFEAVLTWALAEGSVRREGERLYKQD